MYLHIRVPADLVCRIDREKIWDINAYVCAKIIIIIIFIRDSLFSIYKAPRAYLGLGFCVGVSVQTHQKCVPSKGRAGALRQICFSCLSHAPSSEAMLLFKPLKELRAKRKGTHLVVLHARVFLSNFLSMRGFYENKSHRKRWKAETIHLCLAVQYACFAVFWVC